MKILHTSDWHLGRTLYGKTRYDEFAAFLDWLITVMREQCIDVLLVAGDVFDTTTPSNRAQQLYYRFLCQVASTGCRHVVIIGGNHDSPTFLDAPKELLKALNVHVVGSVSACPEEAVLSLCNTAGAVELIVCAVPYLRDRDIRLSRAGETPDEKESRLLEGIRAHYAAVADAAEKVRQCLEEPVPVIAMGHLFTAGGQVNEGDGVRDLYIGSLAHVSPSIFPPVFDYVALGHLHVPQMVGGTDRIRYSGSPLAMGFGEANQTKSVCLVSIKEKKMTHARLDIPVFQDLVRIRGDQDAIADSLSALIQADSRAWVEIDYLGEVLASDLREQIESQVSGSAIAVLRIKNSRLIERALEQQYAESLDELDERQVFERCLDAHSIAGEQRQELRDAYAEILVAIAEKDHHAE